MGLGVEPRYFPRKYWSRSPKLPQIILHNREELNYKKALILYFDPGKKYSRYLFFALHILQYQTNNVIYIILCLFFLKVVIVVPLYYICIENYDNDNNIFSNNKKCKRIAFVIFFIFIKWK